MPPFSLGNGTHTITRVAATITFTPLNWATPVTVQLIADTHFQIPLVRDGTKIFPVEPHLLSQLQGPLAVEGGTTAADSTWSSVSIGVAPWKGGRPVRHSYRMAPKAQMSAATPAC